MAKPLVYQITNTVSAQLQADCVALLGGVSIMSPQPEEAAEIAAACDALLINIGTPPGRARELYLAAARAAAEHERPIVMDAVGYGFSRFRTEAADALLSEIKFSVIKGNFSEIAALCGEGAAPRGVSSECGEAGAAGIVAECAKKYRAAVYCTGELDFISDGEKSETVSGGSKLLAMTSGIGCALGSATALFCSREAPFEASLHALKLFRRAAALAEKDSASAGPYSFRTAFMDWLAELHSEEEKNVR
ncbi:hydroxyethylthiazole kinase [Cloacibacillus sp. An23]|uniref:hydroxyethylthiazole kinase n=1 Tax=Cloacibacillus sp. An23 TaxID=1965591 RepID=UPI000B386274|nr:hydroxyethylthiazole kinase [Cloacibacillus sp. An23]OUO92933.1 hydroxyethylthiazole kinase [Cloacibacillus sp. An23]